jgi:hypothetical protein
MTSSFTTRKIYIQTYSMENVLNHDKRYIFGQISKDRQKNIWIYGISFLTQHIQPILDQIEVHWNTECMPNYNTTFLLSHTDCHLYQKLPDDGYLKYKPRTRTPQSNTYFKSAKLVPTPLADHDTSNVDVSFEKKSIIILGESNINFTVPRSMTQLSKINGINSIMLCQTVSGNYVVKFIYQGMVALSLSNTSKRLSLNTGRAAGRTIIPSDKGYTAALQQRT